MGSPRDDHHRQRRSRRDHPSFSSSLLDSICRSIDESNRHRQHDEDLIHTCEQTTRKKDQQNEAAPPPLVAPVLTNSSSSSSESSCGGGCSSSESDSMHGATLGGRSRSSSCYYPSMQKPKPIRTTISSSASAAYERNYISTQKQKQSCTEGGGRGGDGFFKTKSKALKIYSELKKVKQPLSPGGRLASFLNSLFSSNSAAGGGNAKKAKMSKPAAASEQESACSSASSFSRSCLSKTPSSRGKLSDNCNGGAKRSVRFNPVSVVVDEECRPCGQKNLQENQKHMMISEELRYHVMSESRRVEEVARELLKNYQKKKEEFDHQMRLSYHDHDEDDDAASCASSDLFELDSLSAIAGIERYQQELPVYETTHLGTNRAIAATRLIL